MKSFEQIYGDGNLEYVLSQAKTISKIECEAVYEYMRNRTPKVMMEFGVQYGCSTRAFLEIANGLEIDLKLYSWDIVDVLKKDCVNKKDFTFFKENIEGKEEEIIEKFKPDVIFLDAHPYYMTKKIIEICLRDKIDCMMHDISYELYEALGKRTNNFEDKSVYGAWELRVMEEIFGEEVLYLNKIEKDGYSISFCRDKFGIGIIEHDRG